MPRPLLCPAVLLGCCLSAGAAPQVVFSRLFADLHDSTVVSVATDAPGNIYIAGMTRDTGFPLVRPLQTTGFVFLAKLDPSGQTMLYSTRLGVGLSDGLGGMTVDAAGNVYLAGTTNSPDFPTVNALQPKLSSLANAWAMKIDATGQRVVYSTYLGGTNSTDFGMAIAADAHGCAYLGGVADSADFPTTPGALLRSGPGPFVAKIAADGSRLLYSTWLSQGQFFSQMKLAVTPLDEAVVLYGEAVTKLDASGSRIVYRSKTPPGVALSALAVEKSGFVWAAGTVTGAAPVTADAAQAAPGGGAYWRLVDGVWQANAEGLDASRVNQLVSDASGGLFAATDNGLFRSTDDGAHWTRLLADPVSRAAAASGVVYVVDSNTGSVRRTADYGASWTSLPAIPSIFRPFSIAVDPRVPGRIYAGADRVYRIDEGGAAWVAGPVFDGAGVIALTIDPSTPSVLYAAVAGTPRGGFLVPVPSTDGGIYVSTDGGETFALRSRAINIFTIAADPTRPGVAYAVSVDLLKTTDYGAHWVAVPVTYNPGLTQLLAVGETGAVDVFAFGARIWRSDDGATFAPDGELPGYAVNTVLLRNGILHAGGSVASNAYAMRIDNSGNAFYGTYWGGWTAETVAAVMVDSDGNASVAGSTYSPNFPQRNSDGLFTGPGNAFVVKFGPDGQALYSTTWGGGQERVTAAGVGPGGEVIFAGTVSVPMSPFLTAIR